MRVRHKRTGALGSSSRFNTSALSEIFVAFEDDYTTDYIREYDVWLESTREWKDLAQAFKDRDVIVNNHNTDFFEPPTSEDRERGFTLD